MVPCNELVFLPSYYPTDFADTPVYILIVSLDHPSTEYVRSHTAPLFGTKYELSGQLVSDVALPSFFRVVLSRTSFDYYSWGSFVATDYPTLSLVYSVTLSLVYGDDKGAS